MKKGRLGILLTVAAALVLLTGCNNSRYGAHHDQRLPEIKRLAILVPNVKVLSLHTGGVAEERPDLAPELQARTAAAIAEEVRRCKREAVAVEPPVASTQPEAGAPAARLALVNAVGESIVTHHYLVGKQRTIDYTTGDAAGVLAKGEVDALLCIGVQGTVPTGGREFLKGTAMAVGFITGIHVKVPTKQATITVMLLDGKTGEVLWFNTAGKEIKVTDEDDYRKLCKHVCKYLLEPSE